MTGKGDPLVVRMRFDLMSALSAFATPQSDPQPSPPEAARHAVAEYLRADGYLSGHTTEDRQ